MDWRDGVRPLCGVTAAAAPAAPIDDDMMWTRGGISHFLLQYADRVRVSREILFNRHGGNRDSPKLLPQRKRRAQGGRTHATDTRLNHP